MNEKQAIDNVHTESVGNLYKVLLDSFVSARGDPQKEKEAESTFTQGLKFHRRVHDKAIGLL